MNTNLDPSYSPERSGRYRFTIAHEIGHIWLHLPLLAGLAEPDGDLEPPVGVGPNALEVQANMFASILLMPSSVVPLIVLEEKDEQRRSTRSFGSRMSTRDLVARCARRFEVSKQSMLIRLQKLMDFKAPDEADFRKSAGCFPTESRDAAAEKEQWQRVLFALANLKSLRRAIGDPDPDLSFLEPAAGNASQSALHWLAENAVDDELPSDLSAEGDHYRYGTRSSLRQEF